MSDGNAQVKRLGVLGGGTMGSGIAQTALLAGLEVSLVDVDGGQLERARGVIQGGVERLVSRERISAEQGDAAMAAMSTATDLEALAGSEGVIEAVSENIGPGRRQGGRRTRGGSSAIGVWCRAACRR